MRLLYSWTRPKPIFNVAIRVGNPIVGRPSQKYGYRVSPGMNTGWIT